MLDLLVIIMIVLSTLSFFAAGGEQLTATSIRACLAPVLWLVLPAILLSWFFFLPVWDVLVDAPAAAQLAALVSAGHGAACGTVSALPASTYTTSFLIACFCTLSIFFALMLSRQEVLASAVLLNLSFLVIVSFCFIYTKSLVLMLVTFESLLLVSLNMLRLTSKSERISEAVSEMFMWTLFGSFFLLIGFFLLIAEVGAGTALSSNFFAASDLSPASSLTCIFFFVGFGVKIPTWPFLSWLLKAHVEASVEFSILLSGFIVKLGVLGLWRILDAIAPDWFYLLVVGISCIGILEATIRLFAQSDLKKIVALTTVIEMNWLNLCYVLGDLNLVFLANYLLVAHCFTTSAEFLLVEYISKRYGTRDFWHVAGLWHQAPILWYGSFLVVFTTMGFPGTSIFFAKFLFLATLLSYSTSLFLFFLLVFFLFLPLFFIRLWVPVWFGLSHNPSAASSRRLAIVDLTAKEVCLLGVPVLMGFFLGVYPTFFFLPL